MFLASTRCGIIACRYLTETFYKGIYVTAPEIAGRYNINVRSLMSALRQLTRSGILLSRVGGKQPGFILARDPEQISMLDILTCLEGKFAVPCCKEIITGLKCECDTTKHCAVYSLFNTLVEEGLNRLACVSIKQHARKQKHTL